MPYTFSLCFKCIPFRAYNNEEHTEVSWKNGITQQNAKKSWEVWVVLSGFVFLTFGNRKFWNWRVENSEPRCDDIFQDCNNKKKNNFF